MASMKLTATTNRRDLLRQTVLLRQEAAGKRLRRVYSGIALVYGGNDEWIAEDGTFTIKAFGDRRVIRSCLLNDDYEMFCRKRFRNLGDAVAFIVAKRKEVNAPGYRG